MHQIGGRCRRRCRNHECRDIAGRILAGRARDKIIFGKQAARIAGGKKRAVFANFLYQLAANRPRHLTAKRIVILQCRIRLHLAVCIGQHDRTAADCGLLVEIRVQKHVVVLVLEQLQVVFDNVVNVIDGRFQLFLLFLHGIAADLRHEHAAREGKAHENQHGKAHIILDKKVFHQSLVSNL